MSKVIENLIIAVGVCVIALALFFMVAHNGAKAQEPEIWNVSAFCDGEAPEDLDIIIEAIRVDDREGYNAHMLDPESKCWDFRLVGAGPIPMEIEAIGKEFTDEKGACYRTVAMMAPPGLLAVDRKLVITWQPCPPDI